MRFVGLIALALLYCEATTAQDTPADPRPQAIFSDDFAEDSRSNYEARGTVQWQQGRLSFGEGAQLQRHFQGGTWVEVRCELDFPKPSDEGQQYATRMQFTFNSATPAVIEWSVRRTESGDEYRLSVLDT